MLLAIDAGNTRIKWGIHDGAKWSRTGAIPVAEEIAGGLGGFTLPQHIVISNVAGKDVKVRLTAALDAPGRRMHFIESVAGQCGVRNGYRNATQLGTDRWAALIAAHAMSPLARLIVMAGTATTIDALTAQGEFLGGVILPGVELMHRALHDNAAQLGVPPGHIEDFPKDTANAIASGALQASVGAIMRMREVLRARIGDEPGCCLSGGASGLLAGHLPFAAEIRDNLVLDGLVIIAREVST
jgi:type III pantothenate kinase